jgi:signal transduction histidine kinase
MPDRMRLQDPERAQSLLRCVQELISNTLKHTQASNLWITIDTCNDMLRVDANDDGCGGKESIKFGFGLSGMRDRLDGGIEIHKPDPRGFSLSAWMPLASGLMRQ